MMASLTSLAVARVQQSQLKQHAVILFFTLTSRRSTTVSAAVEAALCDGGAAVLVAVLAAATTGPACRAEGAVENFAREGARKMYL